MQATSMLKNIVAVTQVTNNHWLYLRVLKAERGSEYRDHFRWVFGDYSRLIIGIDCPALP